MINLSGAPEKQTGIAGLMSVAQSRIQLPCSLGHGRQLCMKGDRTQAFDTRDALRRNGDLGGSEAQPILLLTSERRSRRGRSDCQAQGRAHASD